MSLKSSRPIEKDGKTYDQLAITLAISPKFMENDKSASVVLTLRPFRQSQDGSVEVLEDNDKYLIIGDINELAEKDESIKECVTDFLAVFQKLVNARGF